MSSRCEADVLRGSLSADTFSASVVVSVRSGRLSITAENEPDRGSTAAGGAAVLLTPKTFHFPVQPSDVLTKTR